jgi:hypothetical protein
MPSAPPEHHFPQSLLPLFTVYPLSYLLTKPDKPDDIGVSSISKVFVVVGFKVADPTMLSINPTTDHPSRRVAASGYRRG